MIWCNVHKAGKWLNGLLAEVVSFNEEEDGMFKIVLTTKDNVVQVVFIKKPSNLKLHYTILDEGSVLVDCVRVTKTRWIIS